jgi:hypothetical protein
MQKELANHKATEKRLGTEAAAREAELQRQLAKQMGELEQKQILLGTQGVRTAALETENASLHQELQAGLKKLAAQADRITALEGAAGDATAIESTDEGIKGTTAARSDDSAATLVRLRRSDSILTLIRSQLGISDTADVMAHMFPAWYVQRLRKQLYFAYLMIVLCSAIIAH